MIIRISYVFLRDLMREMVRFFAIFIRINLLLFNQLLIRPLVRVVRWKFLLMHRLSGSSRREKRLAVGIDTHTLSNCLWRDRRAAFAFENMRV
jgi:hypothetical protein